MGYQRFERYLLSFEAETPVSIRLNPRKTAGMTVVCGERVPWCENGYYLPSRPNFTFDPLFHAGCYYVQEAASMFLDEVLRQQLVKEKTHKCLDLCAAPGGKSTLLRAALPEDAVLYSNEPMRQRASILTENVQKWGYDNHIVTNLYPRDYRKAKQCFDLILCDVPCSGEGMFRKDPATIAEWSQLNVEKCAALQREIVANAWECLNDGGLFIYSTCTFNTKENEENIRWILQEYDAELLPIDVNPEWSITGSLLEGFDGPVYRFIPGISRGEGLFMVVLRKAGVCYGQSKTLLRTKQDFATGKAGLSPEPSVAKAALAYREALQFLRGEALVLPSDTPRGIVDVTFMGQTLGQVKNIGNRANNLYPKPWRIKTTHIPNEYEPILKPI